MLRSDGTVVLVFPPAVANYGSGDLKRTDLQFADANRICPPLGLLYVASVFRAAGFTPRLLDYSARRFDLHDFEQDCRQAQVLGIHVQTGQRAAAQDLTRLARLANPSLRIMWGGPDCTCYGRLTEGVSLVLRGETEETLVHAAEGLLQVTPKFGDLPGAVFADPATGEVTSNPPAVPVANLDAVPFPDRSIVDRSTYSLLGAFRGRTTAILTARGCNGNCTFCERKFYSFNRYRARSVENVLEEFAEIGRLGYRYVYVNDDNFLAGRERAAAIAEGLVRRQLGLCLKILARVDDVDEELCALLSRAGVRFIDLGIESENADVLAFYNKRTTVEDTRRAVSACDRHGIFVHGHVMFGAPMETEKDLERTLDLVCELPVDTMFLNILGYRRESRLWQEAVAEGRISSDEHTVVACRERGLSAFSEEDLHRIHDGAMRRFYLRGAYARRQLRKLVGTGDFRFKLAMGIVGVNLLRAVASASSRRALARLIR